MIGYHFYHLRIDRFSEHTTATMDVLYKLIECCTLNFFPLQIGHWVHKIKSDTALAQFTNKKLLLFTDGYIWKFYSHYQNHKLCHKQCYQYKNILTQIILTQADIVLMPNIYFTRHIEPSYISIL